MEKKKVLCIDDDPTIRELLKSRLEANFYEVVLADDGVQGLEVYKKEKPDLIVLDIEMPQMDGYTFVLEFKRIGDLKRTPVIMLTAKDGMQDIFKLEGINDYIVKPFRMSELLSKIAKHIDSPNKKILIVDDEESFVSLMESRLKLNGYDITTASDGFEGLEIAKRENPDLIILDIMMPKLDGYNLCRLLKFDQKYQEVAVIFTTAKTQDADKLLGGEVGGDAYITKPFEPEELLQKMKELLWD